MMKSRTVVLNEKRKITLGYFHGTKLENAKSIFSEQEFRFRPRPNHWLGNGVYFFVDDEYQAKWWAGKDGHRETNLPAVLYFPLTISRNELLNLNSIRDLEILDKFAEELFFNFGKVFVEFSELEVQTFHCFLLDYFFRVNNQYKAVRRTFLSTKKEIGLSRFAQLSDQLCVFDQSIIPFSRIKILDI
ncbi:hypothetical protein [Streptococcus sp. NLN76]|uniref:hypothetical protein n=1 Tax=Streptococcus sp. NLN76 TaxID=2822800 RepID=UPI0018ABA2A8|nr:hypothetical protein [Streptococcus sp. NLN76]MBF8970644.1 hypothetical protein [Streptococcus sp. NLN76]